MLDLFKLTLMGTALVFVTGTAALAQPVEYVKVCDRPGDQYLYSPGTATCVNVSTGETQRMTARGVAVGETELAARLGGVEVGQAELAARLRGVEADQRDMAAHLEDDLRELDHQVAISNALEDPDLTLDETFGLRLNWGTANGAHAVGFTGTAIVIKKMFDRGGRLGISAGIGFSRREVGARAGAQMTW